MSVQTLYAYWSTGTTTNPDWNSLTWTLIPNVQEISGRIGKERFYDPWQPSSMVIRARYPSGFYSPNTNLVTGTKIRILASGRNYDFWNGKIASVQVEYGQVYDSVNHIGNTDYITLICEGVFADWGRVQGNNSTVPSQNPAYSLGTAATNSGLTVGTTYSSSDSTTLANSTVDSTWADWINTFATTLASTVKDGAGAQIGVYTKDFVGSLPVSFSDTTNDSTHQIFQSVTMTNEVENYFTQILVNTNVYGQVAVTSGSAPYRTLPLSTISGSTTQATDLANFYLAMYSTPFVGIKEITCVSEAQNTWALDLGYSWWDILGYRTNITFRGTSYYMTILGSQFHWTPAGSTFTYYVASAAFLPYFVLDDANFGVLDTNKLAYTF